MSEKRSLTEAPKNLKEAIDWLASIEGYGASSWSGWGKSDELSRALQSLPGLNDAKDKALGNGKSLDGFIKALANGLAGFLGYGGSLTIDGDGIIKKEDGYNSTYENSQWPGGADEQKQCALIFLGCALTVFYCISYLYWRCHENGGGWQGMNLAGVGGFGPLYFLQSMGYTPGQFNNVKSGKEIANRLGDGHNGIDDFAKAPNSVSSEYINFFNNLVQYQPSEALKHPLASCCKLATKFFESQSKLPTNAKQITKAITEIKTTLETLSQTSGSSYKNGTSMHNPYDALNLKLTDLFTKVTKFKPNEASTTTAVVHGDGGNTGQPTNQSSPVAPVAGTLTTLGLGGGAAAAYIFNLGGAKTIVNGLLRIG
ncbi:variant erythrocyte surface antigen-1 family protein [Babesia caballi]|uniref:Variant erythrocyte surface antigen-1 family protein n=1 Tax=Babesia caballi TaxID=5871 RepID=A0AAV4LSB6_BABCB|nr:variant erythrocyte surface antigen-1 family protein [Babesia caballi]